VIAVAIETATVACAIAVSTSDGRVLERVLDRERRHTEVLMVGLVSLLAEESLSVRDITRVVVDPGPGLFAGLRVGLGHRAKRVRRRCRRRAGRRGRPSRLSPTRPGCGGARHRARLRRWSPSPKSFEQRFELGDDVVATSTPVVATPEALLVSMSWGTSGPVQSPP
jgi:hypothetical protein